MNVHTPIDKPVEMIGSTPSDAPELLEALIEAETVIDALDRSGYSQGDTLRVIRAAIARATGGANLSEHEEEPATGTLCMPVPDKPTDISLATVEDRVNTAMNAMLLAHDFVETFCNSFTHDVANREDANTASYAIGHARETMRDAYRMFHAYLDQEIAKRSASS